MSGWVHMRGQWCEVAFQFGQTPLTCGCERAQDRQATTDRNEYTQQPCLAAIAPRPWLRRGTDESRRHHPSVARGVGVSREVRPLEDAADEEAEQVLDVHDAVTRSALRDDSVQEEGDRRRRGEDTHGSQCE